MNFYYLFVAFAFTPTLGVALFAAFSIRRASASRCQSWECTGSDGQKTILTSADSTLHLNDNLEVTQVGGFVLRPGDKLNKVSL